MTTELPTLTLTLAPHGIDCKVAIAGVDVSHYVTGIEVRAHVHERTRVTLELLAGVHVEGAAGEILRGLVPSHARPIVEAFEVRPGSVLAVRVHGPLSEAGRDHLAAQLRQVWPDESIRFLVLADGIDLAVVNQGGGGTGAGAPALEGAGGRPDGAEDGAGGATRPER